MAQIDPRAAQNALWSTVENLTAVDNRNARRRAGNALAGGNGDLAQAELNEAGLLDDAAQLESQQARRAATERTAAEKERTERTTWLGQGAQALLQVPADQRQEVYQSNIRPVLASMGIGEDLLAQIDGTEKSDANLRSLLAAVGGEVEYEDRVVDGSIMRRGADGSYTNVLPKPFDPREGAQPGYMWTDATRTRQTFIPGGGADPSVIAPRAAAGRAPPRARSSGGGSRGGGGGSRSSGGGASSGGGNPWDRDY